MPRSHFISAHLITEGWLETVPVARLRGERDHDEPMIKRVPLDRTSMDCPRCSGTLETYALFGREAEGCEKCGYVGVAVSHESKPDELESWQEALDRFKKSN